MLMRRQRTKYITRPKIRPWDVYRLLAVNVMTKG
jgi:hypothetical protein